MHTAIRESPIGLLKLFSKCSNHTLRRLFVILADLDLLLFRMFLSILILSSFSEIRYGSSPIRFQNLIVEISKPASISFFKSSCLLYRR